MAKVTRVLKNAEQIGEAIGEVVGQGASKAKSLFGSSPEAMAKYDKAKFSVGENAKALSDEAGDAISTGAVPHPEVKAPVKDVPFEDDVAASVKKPDAAPEPVKAEAPEAPSAPTQDVELNFSAELTPEQWKSVKSKFIERAKNAGVKSKEDVIALAKTLGAGDDYAARIAKNVKASDVGIESAKAVKTAKAEKAKSKNFMTEKPENAGSTIVEAGDGFTDYTKHMSKEVYSQALPNIMSALKSHFSANGIKADAAAVKNLLVEQGAHEQHAARITKAIFAKDPNAFMDAVATAAKEEAKSGKKGWASRIWNALKIGGAAVAGGGAMAWFQSEPDKAEPAKSGMDKDGVSTVTPTVVDSRKAPEAKPQQAKASDAEIKAHLDRLQADHPGLNVKTSIMDYMKSRGLTGTYEERAKVAAENGIKGYRGTAAQNIDLARRIREKYGKDESNLPETLVL